MSRTRDGYESIGKKPGHICVVYVIAPDVDGPSKIGFTTDIITRLTDIQTGSWIPLKVHDVRLILPKFYQTEEFHIMKQAQAGARMAERDAHAALWDCGLRLVGEWFDVTPSEAMQVVEKVGGLSNYRVISLEQIASVGTSHTLDPYNKRIHRMLIAALMAAKEQATIASARLVHLDIAPLDEREAV